MVANGAGAMEAFESEPDSDCEAIVAKHTGRVLSEASRRAAQHAALKRRVSQFVHTEAEADDDDEDEDDEDEDEDEDDEDDSFVDNRSVITSSDYGTSDEDEDDSDDDEAAEDDGEEHDDDDGQDESELPSDWETEEPPDDDDDDAGSDASSGTAQRHPRAKSSKKLRRAIADSDDDEDDEGDAKGGHEDADVDMDVEELTKEVEQHLESAAPAAPASSAPVAAPATAPAPTPTPTNAGDSKTKHKTKHKSRSKDRARSSSRAPPTSAATAAATATATAPAAAPAAVTTSTPRQPASRSASKASISAPRQRKSKPRRPTKAREEANERISRAIKRASADVKESIERVLSKYDENTPLDRIVYALRLQYYAEPKIPPTNPKAKLEDKYVFGEWLKSVHIKLGDMTSSELLVDMARKLTSTMRRHCDDYAMVKYGTIAAACLRFNIPGVTHILDTVMAARHRIQSSTTLAPASASTATATAAATTPSTPVDKPSPSRKRKADRPPSSAVSASSPVATVAPVAVSEHPKAAVSHPPVREVVALDSPSTPPRVNGATHEDDVKAPSKKRAKKSTSSAARDTSGFASASQIEQEITRLAAPQYRRALLEMMDRKNPNRIAYLNSLLSLPLPNMTQTHMLAVSLHVLPGLAQLLRQGDTHCFSLESLESQLFDKRA